MTQTRWFCRRCQREWVWAHEWEETLCPACQSTEIARVTYSAAFPGADIPREMVITLEPSQPIVAHVEPNRTLALSSPEFG